MQRILAAWSILMAFGSTACAPLSSISKVKSLSAEASPTTVQQSSDHFNLAEHISKSPEAEPLHKYVQAGFTGLGFGSKDKVRVESNLTSDIVSAKDDPAAGITAKFTVDMFIADKKMGKEGSVVDYSAIGKPNNPNTFEASMRFLGDDKILDVDGVLDQHFVRDLHIAIPIFPLPLAKLIIQVIIGGEFGLTTQLGVKQNQKMELLFAPQADFNLGLASGVRVLALVDAKVEGTMKMVSMKPILSANLGLGDNVIYGNNVINTGSIKTLDGKIDLVVDLGYKGVLTGHIDAILLKKALTALGYGKIAEGKEWRWNVFDAEPIFSNSVPLYQVPFVDFPKDAGSCTAASDSVDSLITEHLSALTDFVGKMKKGDIQDTADRSNVLLAETHARITALCK